MKNTFERIFHLMFMFFFFFRIYSKIKKLTKEQVNELSNKLYKESETFRENKNKKQEEKIKNGELSIAFAKGLALYFGADEPPRNQLHGHSL